MPKAETFTIFHSPMFAKGLQKSSKHVQPRNSSVEYLWNIKKCYFEGFRSPGGFQVILWQGHVGGWLLELLPICFWAQRVWHSNCLKAVNEAVNESASRKAANEAVNEAAKKKQSANVYLPKHSMLDLKV